MVVYYDWTQQEGRDHGPGRREGRRPTHAQAGRAARRNAPQHRTRAQRRVRQATRSAGSLAAPSAYDPTRASTARASERTYMAGWGALSHVQRGAPRVYQRTKLCCDARAPLARRPPPRAQPATPDTTREPPLPAPVPACVAAYARAQAQCSVRDGEARRLFPPSCGSQSASHARMALRDGGSEGHSSPHPTTPRACTRARGPAAAAKREQARLA